MNFRQKFGDGMHGKIADVRRDIFSDLRDSAFDAIGINKSTRDYVDPIVKAGESLLPKGGAVPLVSNVPTSAPQPTGYSFNANIDFKMVAIGMGVLIAGLYFYKKG